MIVWGAATGSSPRLQAQGTDTNVSITLTPQGTGQTIINSALTLNGIAAPAVSASGNGTIYFDSTSQTFQVSQNGGAYAALGGGGGSSQWTTSGSNIYYSTGNVGIGTTSPQSTLDVSGNITMDGSPTILTASNYMTIMPTGTGNRSVLQLQPAAVFGGYGSGIASIDLCSYQGTSTTFCSGASQYGFVSMSGAPGSNVGGNPALFVGTYGSYPLAFETNNTIQMVISSSGSVGIGTTSPGYTLQVNGSVAGTSAYNNTSDARLKKDVQPIAYGLDTVMKLRPVGFNWITQDQDWKKQHQLGLIAQEVEPVIPEVVTTAKDRMQTKSLAYGELTPVVIKAIQELKANDDKAIQELKADNDNLRAEFEAYKAAHP